MSPDTFTVLHAPGHAPDMDASIIERAESTGADVIAFSEAYKIAGQELHGRPDYRVKVGRSNVSTRLVRSPMGDAGDNPILTATATLERIQYRRPWRVTHPGPTKWMKFTPERWLNVERVQWGYVTVTVIAAHPSPFFAGPFKWRRVMSAAIREVHAAKARGDAVVLVGDLQTRRATALLREAGLEVFASGIDYLAWSGFKRFSTQVFRVEPLDHPWILARFVVA